MKLKKYLPYIFLFMLFLATLAVNMQIGLFGDDYYYATFTRENFGSMHLNHYQEANGRAIVHILDTLFLAILAFFTVATVEQAAMMAFCLTLLLLFYALIKGEKYKTKNILILLVISFFGMATVIFAPSQFIRIGLETDEKYGWSMPYNSPYHEQCFKIYYKIKDTNIVWID